MQATKIKIDDLLSERFLTMSDETRVAYLLTLIFPNTAPEYLEAIFGLQSGTMDEVQG